MAIQEKKKEILGKVIGKVAHEKGESAAHEKGESKEFEKGEDEEMKEMTGKGGPGKFKNLKKMVKKC